MSSGDWSVIVRESSDDSWNWNWISVESWLIKSFVNDCIELWLSSSVEEWVKFDQSFNIWVGWLGSSDSSISDSATSN